MNWQHVRNPTSWQIKLGKYIAWGPLLWYSKTGLRSTEFNHPPPPLHPATNGTNRTLSGLFTQFFCENLCPERPDFLKKILLPSAVHLEERLTVSQSVSSSGKQSFRQSVRQAGRQGETHSLGFFSGGPPPPPLDKHSCGPRSPSKTAVQRNPRAWTLCLVLSA